jgi:RimJ/RimL family protein N-acetyltransferase
MNNPFTSLPVLEGPTLQLKPLQPADAEALYQAASDPLIWEQHPDPLRYQRERFESSYLAGALASGSSFLVTDLKTGEVLGCSRYYDWDQDNSEVAVGFTFIVRSYWGGETNAELKKLMFDYAFQYVSKIWLHIGKQNWRSRKGSEKVGAVFSHEAIKEINGQKHEYAFYCVSRDSRG